MTLLTLPSPTLPGSTLAASPLADPQARLGGRIRQAAIAAGAALLIAAAGALAGTSQYASRRQALVADAAADAQRFHTVFREASEARLQAMSLGVDLVAHSEPLADALRRQDRAELARLSTAFFDQVLKPRYAVTVFDFQGSDGTMVYRAHRPAQFGDDVSRRPMVGAAQKGRATVAGLEIGKSGPELRAMAPVLSSGALVGSLELGSSVNDALQAGTQASGIDYAFALDAKIAQSIDRARGAGDVVLGGALYYGYSRPEVRDLIRVLPPVAEAAPQLVRAGGRDLYVETVALDDVGHQPTTRITLVRDLTPALAAARDGVALVTVLGTGAAIAAVLVGLLQFQSLRRRMERAFAGRSSELRAKARLYDEMTAATHDLQAWKVGILNELVLVVRDPLAAIGAALSPFEGRAGEGRAGEHRAGLDAAALLAGPGGERAASLAFAAAEVRRLNRALDDQMAMVALREELRRADHAPLDLAAVARGLAADLGADRGAHNGASGRLRLALPGDLPPVRGDARLLGSALRTLADWLGHWSQGGALTLEAAGEGGRVLARLTVPGAWTSEPPSLDEAGALSSFTGAAGGGALILARLTFEGLGGSLAFEQQADVVGFTFALRAA